VPVLEGLRIRRRGPGRPRTRPDRVRGDKAYSSRDNRAYLRRRRIKATRWPSKELVADRSQGVQLATLQELARYWTADYDWRQCEARLSL
jgi:hypothetical protein